MCLYIDKCGGSVICDLGGKEEQTMRGDEIMKETEGKQEGGQAGKKCAMQGKGVGKVLGMYISAVVVFNKRQT